VARPASRASSPGAVTGEAIMIVAWVIVATTASRPRPSLLKYEWLLMSGS
jgi:hypothetical protein